MVLFDSGIPSSKKVSPNGNQIKKPFGGRNNHTKTTPLVVEFHHQSDRVLKNPTIFSFLSIWRNHCCPLQFLNPCSAAATIFLQLRSFLLIGKSVSSPPLLSPFFKPSFFDDLICCRWWFG